MSGFTITYRNSRNLTIYSSYKIGHAFHAALDARLREDIVVLDAIE
jgi:hypothetical protein